MVDLISKKKLGHALSKQEIDYMIKGYTYDEIPDYQMAAFLMAVYFNGMNKIETSNFTLALVNSGTIVDLSTIEGIKVDKHSTGGVGDKISLIVIPLVACMGIPVAKMSGKGLGHTGGTIDKLESIAGFRTDLEPREFVDNVNKYKMAIVGQSGNLTPADKKMYALRDVTSTVDSIPLIASSIMSKKIAAGADAIVLDVKVGSGAFVKSVEEARELAHTMVEIGKSLNRRTIAVITDMSQPLGFEVGNANEVKEAIEVLSGKGSEDETTIALTIAAYMTVLGGVYSEFNLAYEKLEEVIKTGQAINKLKELISIQGGDSEIVDNLEKLPQAQYNVAIEAIQSGYINAINAENIGIAAMLLGAGRRIKTDCIDFAAGITMKKKIGDKVALGDILCIMHTNFSEYTKAKQEAIQAFSFADQPPEKIHYIYDVIT